MCKRHTIFVRVAPNPEQTGERDWQPIWRILLLYCNLFSLFFLSSRRLCSTSSDGGAGKEEESRSRKGGRATPEDEKDATTTTTAALRHGHSGYGGGDDDDEDEEVDDGPAEGNGELPQRRTRGALQEEMAFYLWTCIWLRTGKFDLIPKNETY